jgi:hypothetical protein
VPPHPRQSNRVSASASAPQKLLIRLSPESDRLLGGALLHAMGAFTGDEVETLVKKAAEGRVSPQQLSDGLATRVSPQQLNEGLATRVSPQQLQLLEARFDRLPTPHALPPGAVVAFDLADGCPKEGGWTPFADALGRVIIGAGAGEGLTPRPFRVPGGREEFPLTASNIPRHQHDTLLGNGNRDQKPIGEWGRIDLPLVIGGTPFANSTAAKTSFYPAPEQELQPVPTMPPYVALRFCKKL